LTERSARAAPAGAVAFVLKGYPRLSETFIAQEILNLERAGLPIHIVSLRHPTDERRHPIHDEIAARVRYLPEYLHDEPVRVLRGLLRAARRPGFWRALALWLRDLVRDPTPNRVRRFGQAAVLATELPPGIIRLHAHFLHTPASVARYAAKMTGLPWSCSAHAKDIWTTPRWEKVEKLADLNWLVTCTRAGAEHLAELAPRPDVVALVYHGLDLGRFPPPVPAPAGPAAAHDGRSPDGAVRILSVGRLVEKKGYDDLLEALARLPAELHWSLTHVGGGPLKDTLRDRARALGLETRIAWLGAQPQDRVLAAYRDADLFVLASRVAADGDRDGLPNVLMEAQSQGLACVSTTVGGVPELIDDGATGLLVAAAERDALARALEQLIRDPAERRRLGLAGQRRVQERFDMHDGVRALLNRFGLGPGARLRGACNASGGLGQVRAAHR
jgi:glycosyltransferase involved in cell wall biosynthesis